MKNNNKVRIAKIHICSFEKVGNKFKFDPVKYPERLCIIDENKGIVIDVATEHQYPYVENISMLYFVNQIYIKQIKEGERVACIEYHMISPSLELNSNEINKCQRIINKLKKGFIFKDGNQELTNEEYLETINQHKKEEKIKKFGKKGK